MAIVFNAPNLLMFLLLAVAN